MADLRVDNSDLVDLARDLKAAGHAELLKELLQGLKAAAKPITPATRAEALAKLPAGGGLNKRVAKSPQRTTARAGGTTATVAVAVPGRKKGTGASQADEGAVNHPVFGNRNVWAVTKVEPGWFTNTAEREAEQQIREVEEVMDRVARKAGFR